MFHIEAEGRRRQIPGIPGILDHELQILQDTAHLGLLDRQAGQALDIGRIERHLARVHRRLAHDTRLGDGAAAIFHDQRQRHVQAVQAAVRVHAALKAIARIRMDTGGAARARGAQRIKPGALDEDLCRLIRYRRGLAAHHAAKANRAAVISNDAHVFA